MKKQYGVWLAIVIYLIIAAFSIFWGGVKNLTGFYGIVLLVSLTIALIAALLRAINLNLPQWIYSPQMAMIYFLVMVSVGVAYKLQNYIGFFILPIILIVVVIFSIFYALVRTLKNRKNGIYYFIEDDKDKKIKCNSFWSAYKKYFNYGIALGLIDGILTVIFN